MLKSVKALIGAARSQTLTSAELRTALDSARSTLVVAETELSDANAAYRDSLLDVEVKQAVGARERVARAEVDRDRARALCEALEIRLREAEERETEARRQADYDAAVAAAEAAREAVLRIERLSWEIVQELGIVADAEAKVEAANADLPANASLLPGVESSVRDRPAVPRKVLREKLVQKWCHAGTGRPISEHNEQHVQVHRGQATLPGGDNLVLRTFREVEFLPEQTADVAPRLSTTLSLPALLAGDLPIWTPVKLNEPDVVRRAIAERARAPGYSPERKPIVVLEPVQATAQAAE